MRRLVIAGIVLKQHLELFRFDQEVLEYNGALASGSRDETIKIWQ
ncbi:MAG: hypothetical protein ACXWM7_01915 [Parachlamydiaceae bacterium]